ncbi:MAG: lactate/malate family dehydrogenase [Gemmatimonas sp.]
MASLKVGIVGTGQVGASCALAMVARGVCRELRLIDRTRARAKGVACDLMYGAPLSPPIDVRCGDYDALAGASLVVVTVGVNEKTGGATDRGDPHGRLRLLETNARIYQDVIPRIVRAAPNAPILIVTDPPDPLTDVARELAGHDRVFGTGTLLDSLRFRVHLARELEIDPSAVEATILGEHGTSSVFLWSSARIAGVPVAREIARRGLDAQAFRERVENAVRFANIAIIEGIGASQYGIGLVTARIAQAVLRDERAVLPVGSHHPRTGVAFSLPSVVGEGGVLEVLEPELDDAEREGLARSIEQLQNARTHVAPNPPERRRA